MDGVRERAKARVTCADWQFFLYNFIYLLIHVGLTGGPEITTLRRNNELIMGVDLHQKVGGTKSENYWFEKPSF